MLETNNILKLVAEVKKMIADDRSSTLKKDMQVSIDYYNGLHDIRGYRLFFFNNEGQIVEEKNRSNTKIAHQFFTELVDQKVQYLLSNPIEISTEDTELQKYVDYLMYKLGDVELADDGSIKDLDSKIKDLQTNYPTFFQISEPEQPDNGFKSLGGADIPPGGKIDPNQSMANEFSQALGLK